MFINFEEEVEESAAPVVEEPSLNVNLRKLKSWNSLVRIEAKLVLKNDEIILVI